MNISLEGVEEFKQIMNARIKECGKNAKTVCVALFLNIFKSLRNKTKIATYSYKELKVLFSQQFLVGYRREKGEKHAQRVLLEGSHRVNLKSLGMPVYWLTTTYAKHEQYHVYYIKDLVKEPVYEYLVVAKTLQEAFKYAKQKKLNHIKQYRGLAKNAMSVIRQKLMNQGIQNGDTSGNAKILDKANSLVKVQIADRQISFNSREVSINAHDQLDYSELAIIGGKNEIDNTVRAQLRKTAGQIAHFTKNNSIRESMLLAIEKLKD